MSSTSILRDSSPRSALGVFALAALAVALPAFVSTADSQPDRSQLDLSQMFSPQTLQLLVERRCSEVLPELQQARLRAPQSAEMALLVGRCQVQTFDYVSAAPVLREARALDPQLRDTALFLAIANYHLEDYPAAYEAIDAARGNVSPDSVAELELYSGLLLLQRGDFREAALELGRSRLTDGTRVEPVASFYEGLAWQSVNERRRAREALERVIAMDGKGVWGRRAVDVLAGESLKDRAWVSLSVGLEYDSNVVLLGEGLEVPANLERQGDGGATWYLNAGTELFRNQYWSGGITGAFLGTAHFELNEFDTQLPLASAWLDRVVGKRGLIRARYYVGHAWVDYSDFLTLQNARLSYYHNWGRQGNSELWTAWEKNNFHFDTLDFPEGSPPGAFCQDGVDEGLPCAPTGTKTARSQVRDGNGFRIGLKHEYVVRALEGDFLRTLTLRGSYGYRFYVAEGDDWDFQSHELLVGIKALLPGDVEIDVAAAFVHQPFENPSTYPPPTAQNGIVYPLDTARRLDQFWRLETKISRPITDHVSISADYRYTNADSNVALFRYDRHVVGLFATLSY